MGFFWRGCSPPHQLERLGSAVSSPSGVRRATWRFGTLQDLRKRPFGSFYKIFCSKNSHAKRALSWTLNTTSQCLKCPGYSCTVGTPSSPRSPTLSQRHMNLHVWSYLRIHDVVIDSKFHRNPFRGLEPLGGRMLAIPITLAIGFYNSLHYRTSRDRAFNLFI